MKIAYIISAYKLPEQLVRLVQRLSTDDTVIFIHVDKKTPHFIFEKMRAPLASAPNVYFIPRHVCHYCEFGHVQATLTGINELQKLGLAFDYVVLLTGQDYPVKSNQHIREFLSRSNGASYIGHVPLPYSGWSGNSGMDRIQYWHSHCGRKKYVLPRDIPAALAPLRLIWNKLLSPQRKFPAYVLPHGGDSYWCLSKSSIMYILEFLRQHREYVSFFKYVHIPDEIFFQTILLNSPLRHTLVNDDLRYVDWYRPYPPYPAILKKADFNQFMATGDLFARKFDMSVDSEVLDMIDAAIVSGERRPSEP